LVCLPLSLRQAPEGCVRPVGQPREEPVDIPGTPEAAEAASGAVHSPVLCAAGISTGGRGISANLGAPPPGPFGPGFTFCGVAACS
jgi:hypothetical protein